MKTRFILTIPLCFFFLQVPSHAQEAPKDEKKPSIFDLLRKKTPSDSPGSDGDPEKKESEGLLGLGKLLDDKRVTDLVDGVGDAWVKGKDGFDQLFKSGSEASKQIEQILTYVDQKVAGRKPAFTDEQIQAQAELVLPVVEELNGRKFESKPVIKSVGNLQMVKILTSELVPQYQKRFPELPKPLIYLKSLMSAGYYTPALLGKYGTRDQYIYVLPQNIHATIEEQEIPMEHAEDVLKIIIGHELTHGLQDQEINLEESILAVKDPDAMKAFNATIEGHAVYIQNALANRLGLEEASAAATQLLTTEDLNDDAWAFERMSHASAVQMEQVYLGGERFIQHHFRDGGIERVWRLLNEPPQRSSMITQPETYTPNPPPLPDYESKFAFATETSGLQGWVQMSSHLGDFDLRARLASVKKEQRESILRGMNQAAVILLMDEAELYKTVEIALFNFRTREQAEQMVEAVNKLIDHKLSDIDEVGSVRLLSQDNGNYNAGNGYIGQYRQYTCDTKLFGKSTRSNVIVNKGTTVVHFLEQGSGLKKDQVDALIRGAAERL